MCLVLLDLWTERIEGLLRDPRGVLLADDAAEEAALERGPGDDAEAVFLCGWQDLALDVADEQVVDGLLADQAGVVALLRGRLGLGDVPAGEVAASGVQDFALLYGDLDGLPDRRSYCQRRPPRLPQ
jgi:hypothetical protein